VEITMRLTHKKTTTNTSIIERFGHFTIPLKKTENIPKFKKTLNYTQTTSIAPNKSTKEIKGLQLEAEIRRNQAQIYASVTPPR